MGEEKGSHWVKPRVLVNSPEKEGIGEGRVEDEIGEERQKVLTRESEKRTSDKIDRRNHGKKLMGPSNPTRRQFGFVSKKKEADQGGQC